MKITRFQDVPQFTRSGSYEVDLSPDRLVKELDRMASEERLDLDPDFQRGHVWTEAQQKAYVEYFLRGGRPARVVYINFPSWHNKSAYDDRVLVDGKQRIQAWRRFIDGEFKIFGSKFSEYTDSLRLNQTMKLNVNDLQTRAEVLQWYLDFNSGGTVHTDKELSKVRKLLAKAKGS